MADGPHAVNDAERRTRVRALVESARRQAADSSMHSGSGPSSSAGLAAQSLPGYEVANEIHRGGQGVVYLARQRSTGRTVAIKIMREGPFGGARDRARFEREVHILGQLNHPNIVGILDSGTAAGSSYFVMDFVQGEPLDRWIANSGSRNEDQHAPEVVQPTIERTLHLFVKVCDAVHAGHLRGVIHRDLKPNNILVGATGEPHILDFGLAKLDASGNGGARQTMTATGHFVGSLPWASPEQAVGDTIRIDIRTDVYSLGVMLYQTLAGRFPYSVACNMRDALDRIMTAEPPRPSSLCRGLDDELDTIVLKCLAKDPERRYDTAGELARDLRHYLADEPIQAKRDSGWYVLRKTLRRYRATVGVAATFILLVTASAVSLSVLYGRQGVLLNEISRERDRALAAEHAAEDGRRKAEYESYMANIAAADGAITANDGGAALQRLKDAPAALRNWEWRFLRRAADQSIATLHGLENRHIRHVGFSPDGRYLAGLSHIEGIESRLDVWDWMPGAPLLKVTVASDHIIPFHVVPYRFASQGSSLQVCPGDGDIVGFELEQRRVVDRDSIAGMPPESSICVAAPPTFVANRALDSRTLKVWFWNVEDDAFRGEFTLDADWINASACAPDGRRFALGLEHGVVYVCALAPQAKPHRFKAHEGRIHGLAFNSDGRLLAISSEDGLITIWRLGADDASPSAEPVISFRGSAHRVGSVAFSPEGSKLAAASADKTLRIWNVADGELLHTLRGHAGALCAVAFHPDGSRLASGSYDATVKLWDLARPSETIVNRDMPGYVGSVDFDASGTRVIAGTTGGARVLDAASGLTAFELSHTPPTPIAMFDPDDSHAIVSCFDGTVRMLDLATGCETNRLVVQPNGPVRIAINVAGTQLACVSLYAGVITLREPTTGAEVGRIQHHDGDARVMAYSPDGATLATGSTTGEVCLWDCFSAQQLWATREHTSGVLSVAFSRDGSRLATASNDASIKLYDARTGEVQRTLRPQLGDVWCVAFSPDGTRLVAGGRDRTVRMFDTATGYEVLSLRGPTGTVLCVAFSPDGHRIAAGTWTREVFIWDSGADSSASDEPGEAHVGRLRS